MSKKQEEEEGKEKEQLDIYTSTRMSHELVYSNNIRQ